LRLDFFDLQSAEIDGTVIIADVTNGKTWKVDGKELVEVLKCELVLT